MRLFLREMIADWTWRCSRTKMLEERYIFKEKGKKKGETKRLWIILRNIFSVLFLQTVEYVVHVRGSYEHKYKELSHTSRCGGAGGVTLWEGRENKIVKEEEHIPFFFFFSWVEAFKKEIRLWHWFGMCSAPPSATEKVSWHLQVERQRHTHAPSC